MKVKFVPQNVEFEIKPDQSVLKLAQEKGVFIKSVCNGLPSCAECRVKMVEGEENVLPPGVKELALIGTGHFIDRRRLSCQLHCFGDVVIDLTEQIAKQNAGPKRPQGSKKTEDQVSHAVTGNFLEQDQEIKVLAEETAARADQNQQTQQAQQGQRQNQGQRHHHQGQQGQRHQQGGPRNDNRRDGGRSGGGGGGRSGGGGGNRDGRRR